jgi:hypothetical protein
MENRVKEDIVCETEICTEVDSNLWNNNLKKSNYSTFFQTAEFQNSNLEDIIPIFINIIDKNNDIVGQLGLRIINTTVMYSSSIFKRFSSIIPRITRRIIWIYGPIIHSEKPEERKIILIKILDAVNKVVEDYNVVHIEAQTAPYDLLIDEDYKEVFQNYGYSVTDFCSYIANLSISVNDLWLNISKKTRGDVTRAKRREIVIKNVESYNEIDDFINLNKEWAKTKGLIITDPEKEKEMLWKNHKNGIEKIFLAYKEKKLISGLRIGVFNKIAYTNFVINSYKDPTNLGGTLLTWNALEWAKNNDYHIFDFSGGPLDGVDSLLAYKKKWGGKQYIQYDFIKINKKFSYLIYKKLFKMLKWYHRKRSL